jgi:hypothetical protein
LLAVALVAGGVYSAEARLRIYAGRSVRNTSYDLAEFVLQFRPASRRRAHARYSALLLEGTSRPSSRLQ